MLTVTKIDENEDGSATVELDLDKETLRLLVQEGVISILRQTVEKEKAYELRREAEITNSWSA